MPTPFVTRINEFLDLEAHGDNYADYALLQGYDLLDEDKPKQVFEEDSRLIEEGEISSASLLRGTAFPSTASELFKRQSNSRLDEVEGSISRSTISSYDDWERWISKPGGLIDRVAALEGISAEDLRNQMSCDAEESRLRELRAPTFHRFLLRKFLTRLDGMVEQVERLEVLPLHWDSVPPQMKVLLNEAHESWLLGQEVSTAVLCGAALEESLKLILGRSHVPKLSTGIKKAVPSFLHDPSPALDAAWKICAARAEAVHDPRKYLSTPQKSKTDVLHHARFVIGHIFSERSI